MPDSLETEIKPQIPLIIDDLTNHAIAFDPAKACGTVPAIFPTAHLLTGDDGSRLRLSFGGHSTAATIVEPHDPPLLGAGDDRSARSESHAKDFKPLSLGSLALTAGKGSLVLTAETVPGNTVADVRRLILDRRGE